MGGGNVGGIFVFFGDRLRSVGKADVCMGVVVLLTTALVGFGCPLLEKFVCVFCRCWRIGCTGAYLSSEINGLH